MTLAILLICSLNCVAFADPEADAKKAIATLTEQFYDQYVEVEQPGPWIQKSKHLTPEFKAAYKLKIDSGFLGADPIINAQDSLPSSAKAQQVTVNGETAIAVMGLSKPSEYGWDGAKVYLVLRDGVWLINGINDIRAK